MWLRSGGCEVGAAGSGEGCRGKGTRQGREGGNYSRGGSHGDGGRRRVGIILARSRNLSEFGRWCVDECAARVVKFVRDVAPSRAGVMSNSLSIRGASMASRGFVRLLAA